MTHASHSQHNQQYRARIHSGSPYPLGATSDSHGTNFAVFSAHAERIELCLFDAGGKHEIARHVLPECTDEVWHGYLPDVQPGQLYGYRAYGPYQPEHGHRFNPNKLLIDPYAKRLHGQLRWSDALYGYRVGGTRGDLSFDRRDSAPAMPKCVVVDDNFHWGHDTPLNKPWERTVIYEAHVRGMTMRAGWIPANERGTFAALADPDVIDHLVKLGVTSIELLPVHANVQDRRLLEKDLRNYWGYNTLSYFAPEPSYLSDGSLNEMRRAIHQLHSAGIEVILDVVYNHTAEESELGPTLSFRGLDNCSYYRLLPDRLRHCINDTGCGNTVNLSHPRVIQLVMDSLRYWVQSFHVDGFRFDLGVTLGREIHGFDPGCGFFDALRQDPVLAQTKLISEPWDIGPGGYQIGNHPAGFAEWNGRFRDDVRRFWKGDAEMRGALAARLLGSSDLFAHHRRRPWASVNFVTAHDGFTLQDLVSYNDKHNEANGEDNRDGGNDNESFNWGAEGPTDDEGILATREKVKRAMLMTLFFSNGTPMLLAGDEFGRTQRGNNNAYCHDDELSWMDWEQVESDAGRALLAFVTHCIAVRAERPTLHAAHFYTGETEILPGLLDTDWFDESGTPMDQENWDYAEGRLLALRRVARAEHKRGVEGEVSATLLLVNAHSEDREFILPEPHLDWIVLIDAAESNDGPSVRKPRDNRITVASHSAMLLVADHVAL
ncbi:glycogen debranching protein GlgX [Oxalicibacterium solurbis]|uniref:Glycogen operon protein GlgX homolog n=1 Tax=Oxalicibacterium solurbis TaxID=69280 RepID=A0A8J3AXZ5_9BURK|nr:glycogen debranching protein GlgX [Oxalicibacterium solurbis]GGI55584.1 glycogen operon protein GlgX homolog [Oxalicibacterium solurbis]